jgi:tetratricopeptide (TPR) repeat protein
MINVGTSNQLRNDKRYPKVDLTGPPKVDLTGPLLAVTFAVLAVLVVGFHMYLAYARNLDPVHTLLLNLLAIIFTAICTIWVGRWSALRENKSFIRAALRTTYGLSEGLKVAEQKALEGVQRMASRTALSSEMQGEFWQEVLGRVIDQLNALMRRAQETVDNWQELGPEEVERLTHAEYQKEIAINELKAATQQVTAVLQDVAGSESTVETARLRARVEALERERQLLEASSALSLPARGEARKLIAMGALEEAVDAYSTLIAAGTGGHTIYLARARARYLAGDRDGALEDLHKAEEIDPTDDAVRRLRRDIQEGKALPPVAVAPPNFKPAINKGNAALASGDAEAALRHFREARKGGLFPILAAQNEAMCLLLLGDPERARELVSAALGETTGPFVRVQAFALLSLTDALGDGNLDASLSRLSSAVAQLALSGNRFNMAQSPLQFLVLGLQVKGLFTPACNRVIAVLVTGSDPVDGAMTPTPSQSEDAAA